MSVSGLNAINPTDDKKTKAEDSKRSMAKRDDTTTFVVNYVGYATFPPVKGSVGMTQQKVFGLTCVQE